MPDRYTIMPCVGLLMVELSLGEGESLKDKRRVIKSLLDKIRHRFNVSAAETGFLDSHRASQLTFSAVANDRRFLNEVLDKVLQAVESEPRVVVTDSFLEFI